MVEMWETSSCLTLLLLSVQGSIQQLLLRSDPTAPDDQCEEDDPYVSVNRHTPRQRCPLVVETVHYTQCFRRQRSLSILHTVGSVRLFHVNLKYTRKMVNHQVGFCR